MLELQGNQISCLQPKSILISDSVMQFIASWLVTKFSREYEKKGSCQPLFGFINYLYPLRAR